MKKSFFCKLSYGFTYQPNCSNFGDRLSHWSVAYEYLSNQNLLSKYTIVVPKNHWPELRYIKLPNTISSIHKPHEYTQLTKKDVQYSRVFSNKKNLFFYTEDINFIDPYGTGKNLKYIKITNNEITQKIKQFKQIRPYISVHIRKVVGVVDSKYSFNTNGYEDMSFELYNSLIKILKEETGLPVYVASDLPIQIIKENIKTEIITREDFISEDDEIHLIDEYSEKIFLEANICDWLAIYYSDYQIMTNDSKYSLTAKLASVDLPKRYIDMKIQKIVSKLNKLDIKNKTDLKKMNMFIDDIYLNKKVI